MAKIALVLAIAALVAAMLPSGIYVGMSLSGLGLTIGIKAFLNRSRPPWSRLAAAAAITLGIIALLLSTGRFALTWWAISKLTQML